MTVREAARFRDWLLGLLIEFLLNSDWAVRVVDFKKMEGEAFRGSAGVTEYSSKTIYLDPKYHTPDTFIHELCHMAMISMLTEMAKQQPLYKLRKLKGETLGEKHQRWVELRVREFESLFSRLLTQRQIKKIESFTNILKKEMA